MTETERRVRLVSIAVTMIGALIAPSRLSASVQIEDRECTCSEAIAMAEAEQMACEVYDDPPNTYYCAELAICRAEDTGGPQGTIYTSTAYCIPQSTPCGVVPIGEPWCEE